MQGAPGRRDVFIRKELTCLQAEAAGLISGSWGDMPVRGMVKHLPWVARLLALALFAWVGAGIIVNTLGYFLYSYPSPAQTRAVQESRRQAGTQAKTAYDIISERDLLKVSKNTQASLQQPEEDIVRPIAEMGLALKGTIAGPKEIARAIIEDRKEQKSYKIGDEIKGAILLAIYRNKIIVDVGGQEQMLVIEDVEAKAKASVAAAAAPRSGRPARGLPVPAESPGLTNVMKNLDEYIGKARVVPYFKGGEPYGFRVSNLSSDAMIYELGVRSGDVIRSVNGISIRTPEDAFKAYQQFQNESSVQVELERNGEPTTVTVPLR